MSYWQYSKESGHHCNEKGMGRAAHSRGNVGERAGTKLTSASPLLEPAEGGADEWLALHPHPPNQREEGAVVPALPHLAAR